VADDSTWGTGATRYHWDPDVRAVVQRALKRFPRASANTYVCHPYCGWGQRSVDFWGPGGRGDPIGEHTGELLLDFLFTLEGRPNIRHWIYRHRWWTSWGGYGVWSRNDHIGNLRHVHLTYHPVPPLR
jgi:hypothetical protein